MSRPIEESPPDLGRVLELTPSGRRAVDAPQLGLTISQRWLLMRIGEGASLADIGASAGAPAQVVRLPRDAARLVGLGLAVDVGEPGPVLFSNTTRSGELTGPAPLSDASLQTSQRASRDFAPDTAAARSSRPRMTALGLIAIGLAGAGAGAAYWALRPGRAPATPLPVAAVPAKPRTGASADVVVLAPAESVAVSAPLSRDTAPAAAAVVASVGLAASSPIEVSRAPTAPEPPAPSSIAKTVTPPSKLAAAPAPAPVPVLRLQPTPAPVTGVALSERLAAGPAPTVAAAAIRPPPAVAAASPPPQAPAPAPAPAPSVPEVVATAPVATDAGVARAATLPPLAPISRSTPTYPRDVSDDTRREVSLQAQLVIGANGEVTRVEFPGSSSRNRPYERVARSALLQWRFPAGTGDRSYRTELSFKPE